MKKLIALMLCLSAPVFAEPATPCDAKHENFCAPGSWKCFAQPDGTFRWSVDSSCDGGQQHEETCPDVQRLAPDNADSVCLEPGETAPFRLRGLAFPEHLRREKIDARNADLWEGITKGDVVVVSKPAFYVLITGGTAAVVTAIVLGGLAAAHKL